MHLAEDIEGFHQIFEKQFATHDYHGHFQASQPFDVKLGTGQVLISAPHTTKLIRNGSLKEEDQYTGALGLLLQRHTNCHLIYTTRCNEEDPNYIIDGSYKGKMKELVELLDIRYVIDLHAAAASRPFDVDLGTQYGKTIDSEHVTQLKACFQRNGIMNVYENHTFAATHAGTVTAYCHHQLGLGSIQMEINKKFREPEQQNASFSSLFQAISEYIAILEKHI